LENSRFSVAMNEGNERKNPSLDADSQPIERIIHLFEDKR